MNIRFYNGKILTMNPLEEIFEGELWVKGSRIEYVGPKNKNASKESWDREIDLKGNLLMPGFKNAHAHSAMVFLRSFADDYPLQAWLNEKVFPYEAKLEAEDVYLFSKLAIMEYLTSGITASFDMYLYPYETAKASVDCGFRTVLTSGINDFGPDIEKLEEQFVSLNKTSELISFIIGFHAEYTTKLCLLEEIARLTQKYKSPLYTHNSETEAEVKGCIERHGITPTCLFDKLGMFDYGGGGYHCVHLSDEDLEIFKKRQLYVVSCPDSNAKLASGIAPLTKMLSMDIPVALGTDGAASNNSLDFFKEMYLASVCAKLREKDAAGISAQRILHMATSQGAKAMGLNDCDCLKEGKLADLIVIDLQQPNMQPIHSIEKNLVYSGSKQNVTLTMVNGKILYENGNYFIGEDPKILYKEVDKRVDRIIRKA